MGVSFIRPEWLWLLLVVPPLIWLGWFNGRNRVPWRRYGSLGLRMLVLVALIGSLAGTQLRQSVQRLTTIFLLDSSDSISPAQRSANEQFIIQALQQKNDTDQAAIVVFGDNALVERVPSELKRLGAIQSVPIAARTDIAEAIQLGLALFPADTQKRLVLLSDGAENTGNALQMARLAQQREVPIDVVPTTFDSTDADIQVVDFQAPATARSGQEIQLVATIESNVEQQVQLRWLGDSTILSEEPVNLVAGTTTFTETFVVQEQGFKRYQVQVVAAQDVRPQNNVAGSLIRVDGPPKILIVEGTPGEAAQLYTALEATQLEAEVIPPAALPTTLPELAEYESIMLVNVPAREIPEATQALINTYVHDLGNGLIMVGGMQSFGVGAYTDTPIAEALPVDMDVRNREERPDIAIVFVIDKSGSMDACHCNGGAMGARQESGARKIDIAKEAVAQAATVLGERDSLGVVTFDDSAHWDIELQQVPALDAIEEALGPIPPNGGTNVVAGMQAAYEQLQQSPAKIKHAILLTDGWGNANIDGIVQDMRDSGMTLSVVAAGNGSDEKLEDFANAGAGRYYPVRTMDEVPQIFLQETIQAVGTYIVEEPFTPAYSGDTPILAALQSGLPQLLGYNGTVEKDAAQIALVAPDGSPILAQWQYGLGRSVAWTSDLKGKWAQSWIGWEQFPRFVAQMVGWTLPRVSSDTINASSTFSNGKVNLVVYAQNEDGSPMTGLNVAGRIVGSDLTQDVVLNEIGPGAYEVLADSPGTGVYLVYVSGQDASGATVFARTIGLEVPYSPEYRQGQANPVLLETLAQATTGRVLTQPQAAFDHTLATVRRAIPIDLLLLLLAALLLPLDIAIRRVAFGRRDWQRVRQQRQVKQQAAAAPSATMESLHQAKSRTRQVFQSEKTEQTEQTIPRQQPTQPLTPPAPTPTRQQPQASELDEIEDPFKRLKAAKNRARRK